MKRFIQHHRDSITHTLSGFDRLRFKGCLSLLSNGAGLDHYMKGNGRPFAEARSHFKEVTESVKELGAAIAEEAGRPLIYVMCPSASKEKLAREIRDREGVADNGLICVLTCVEPCYAFSFHKVRGQFQWAGSLRQCLHQYFYMEHHEFGFCHVRIQSWCPFTVNICINGREWLARQMDASGIGYARRENCFLSIDDPVKAQKLSRSQSRRRWNVLLNQLCKPFHPAWQKDLLLQGRPLEYYWTTMESEWATDVVFRSRRALDKVYDDLIRYSLQRFDSSAVMRFWGQRVPLHGEVDARFKKEVSSNCRRRPEGIRVRHWAGPNSVKIYNKQHRVLRVETTICDPTMFKSVRAKATDPDGPKSLLPMMKGVQGLNDRVKASQGCNDRYLDSLADAVLPGPSLGKLLTPLTERASLQGSPVRGLRFFDKRDRQLLAAISQGDFAVNGFRNRDIREQLHKDGSSVSQAKLAGRVTRQMRMLRAHKLIEKVAGTHRYRPTSKGQQVIAAITAATNSSIDQLLAA